MKLQSPKENPFGFLRAKVDTSGPWRFDTDLFFYQGETISHYTDLNGLFGIIESGGFWLSDHRFLNDKEEFENGRKLTLNLLTNLKNKIRYSELKAVLDKSISILESYTEEPYFVCSFSKKPDSLDQWRSYADNGQGVSITFDNTRNSLSHFFALPIFSTTKVLYDENKKIWRILNRIRRYRKEYLLDMEFGNTIEINDWGEQLALSLAIEFINFKHSEYSSEQEIRMIVASSHLNRFNGIKHRVSDNTITRYITSKDIYSESFEAALGTDKLPIKEIRIGPASNHDMTAKSIEAYLTDKGYRDVKVIKSNVPYRGSR